MSRDWISSLPDSVTTEQAQQRLQDIEADAAAGRPLPPIRERLDLFYRATNTTPATFDPDEDDAGCFCCT